MPSANLETITGTVFYQGAFSSISEANGDKSLLIIDKPPFGQYNSAEAAQAASLLRDFMGVNSGDSITIDGFRDSLQVPGGQTRPVILIVRIN